MMSTRAIERSKAMKEAIKTVRDLINKTPANTLAALYRTTLATLRDACQKPEITQQYIDLLSITEIVSAEDTASEFKSWIDKTINSALPDKPLRDFLMQVTTGIIETTKRGAN